MTKDRINKLMKDSSKRLRKAKRRARIETALFVLVLLIISFTTGFQLGDIPDDEYDDNPSIYEKCHQVAVFVGLQEEDMGSSTELPRMLRLRCAELQEG